MCLFKFWSYLFQPHQIAGTLNLFSQKLAEPRTKSVKTELWTLPNPGTSAKIELRIHLNPPKIPNFEPIQTEFDPRLVLKSYLFENMHKNMSSSDLAEFFEYFWASSDWLTRLIEQLIRGLEILKKVRGPCILEQWIITLVIYWKIDWRNAGKTHNNYVYLFSISISIRMVLVRIWKKYCRH